MNIVYRSVWCAATSTWVAASELTKGKTKSSRSRIVTGLGAAALLAASSMANAQNVPQWDTATNDGRVGTVIQNSGGTSTLTVNTTDIGTNNGAGYTYSPTMQDYASHNALSGNAATDAALLARSTLALGSTSVTIAVPDPITGAASTVSVYNSSGFSQGTWATARSWNNSVGYSAAGDSHYVDTRMGAVGPAGGTLKINMASDGSNRYLPTHASDWFHADGTGLNSARLEWVGTDPISVDLGSTNIGRYPGTELPGTAVTFDLASSTNGLTIDGYSGSFTAFDGSTRNVSDLSEFRAYNDWLVSELQAGRLKIADYNAQLAKGYKQGTQTTVSATVFGPAPDSGDEVLTPKGRVTWMHADGKNGSVYVAKEGVMFVRGATAGVLAGTNGATVTNDGRVSTAGAYGGISDSKAMSLETGSHGFNNGVINAGFNGNAGNQSVTNQGGGWGVSADGAGTTFVNSKDGIINVAPGGGLTDSYAVVLGNTATGLNQGTINLGVSSEGYRGLTDWGVKVLGGSEFVNDTGGAIYWGRTPQYAPGEATTSVATSTRGIVTYASANTNVENKGTITVGPQAERVTAMLTNSDGYGGSIPVRMVNSGTITLEGGGTAAAPAQNIAMAIENAGAPAGALVTNTGTINLQGRNSVGQKITANYYDAKASNTGTINVAGGIDGVGLRNYGVWAEGMSAVAAADVGGNINLTGEGAIAVHARGKSVVNVASTAVPTFASGTNQIGFYVHGAEAKINIAAVDMAVTTEDSTLFRMAEGADFNGAGLTLAANGKSSTIAVVSGAGSSAATDGAVLNVNGTGAKAVLVEGGATGDISAATTINLNANNAIAGIVDGQKHDINGVADSGPNAATRLDAATNLIATAATTGVTGYITRNLGQLVNQGTITLNGADSIGIDVQQGGRLANSGLLTVNAGVGVRATGADTQISQLGTVVVNGGLAGVQLRDGAALTLAGTGNTITTQGTANGVLLDTGAVSLDASNLVITANGTGAGIENKAEIGAVKLNNVTVNAGDGAAIRTATSFDPASTATLNVSGSGTGFAFRQFDGSNASGDLNIGPNYQINVLAGSNGGTGVTAQTTGNVTTGGTIDVQSVAGGAAVVAHEAATISNTGTLRSVSTVAPVIDGTGTGKTIANTGTVQAASNTAVAIQASANADTVNLTAGAVTGAVNTGEGSDKFNWTAGTLDGEVNMGNGAGNAALVGAVDLSTTRHIVTGSGAGNTLEFRGTNGAAAKVGSFAADDLARGTNIGTGWNTLAATQAADVRIVDTLQLAGADSEIKVASGATLRVGGSGATAGSINNHDVVTSDAGGAGTLVFDNLDTQGYSGVISGAGNFTRAAGGTTVFTGDNTYTGTTTIDATGTLQLGEGAGGGATGSLSPSTAIVDNGALVVNRNNAVALDNVISGSGSFTQQGTGVTTLGGNNSYAGATEVTAGTLRVNGNQSAATGQTTVHSGATLGGTGVIGGNVAINDGATLSPGSSPGTLTINGNLGLAPTANLAWEYGQANVPGGAYNDLVQVGGDLTLDGTINVAQSTGGTFGPGVYRVFDYGGSLTDNTLEIGTLPAGNTAGKVLVQTSVANQVNLVNSNGVNLSVWDGPGNPNNSKIEGGTGVWQAGTGNSNWTQFADGATTVDGQVNAPFANNSFAVFTGTGGTVTVDNGAATGGQVQIAGMQFLVDGYTVQGDALRIGNAATTPTLIRVGASGAGDAALTATVNSVIEGTGGIEKTDGGKLILGGANTYTGGTTVSGGTLQISKDANLGAAGTGLTLNSGTLQLGADVATARNVALTSAGGTVDVNGFRGTLNGAVSGSGMLKVVDSDTAKAGTLNLTQANSYTGGTVINGSAHADGKLTTVMASTTGALGTGPVLVQQGTLLFDGPGVSAGNLAITADAGDGAGAIIGFMDQTSAGNATISSSKNSTVLFYPGSTAADATLANSGGTVLFSDSSAGNARIDNSNAGMVEFGGSSTADKSVITNASGSTVTFGQTASGGTAHITNNGTVSFADTASAENATIVHNAGGLVDISGTTTGTAIGSLSGAGNVSLGARQLTLGNLNRNDSLSGVISDGGGLKGGTGGSLVKVGSGTLTLSGQNNYTGTTTVAAGTLLAGAANTLSAASAHTVNAGATLDTAGHNQTVAALTNAGTVSLRGATAGNTLTVKGEYVGNGGTLALNTVLNATGPSDRLVLDGAAAKASGNTHVAITNLGGLGAQTTGNGIEVVTAQNGATSTRTAFALNGEHVDAGAFQYRLYAGDTAGSGDSWYLRTDAPAAPKQPAYREEVPLHAALPNVVRQADLAMLSTLHRRVGDENRPITVGADGKPAQQGWGGDNRRAWGRVIGGDIDVRQKGEAGVDSHASMGGFQTGVDLYGDSSWSAGIYTGMLRTDGTVRGNVGGEYGLAGRMRLSSQYLGAYGTYLKDGFYTDLVLQYGMHDVVSMASRSSTLGDASSLTASIEAGKSFALGEGWAVEPQAQLIYNRMKFDTVDVSGASIRQDAANQVIGRLGVRIAGDVQTSLGRLQPYGRINLWHGFSGKDTTTFVGPAGSTAIGTKIGYTSTELAAGFTLRLTPTTSVYGEVGKLFKVGGGNSVKSSVQGSVGVKLNF
ncbi:autotransporter outer membrane beta-barrel domain-containing protein [Variovorax sp. DXTD-1]|uniref:autotransporter outer membrane beta-barrel domain-containing protein n=1 Tax=Variovorax sp. DXTD-1 TaxID=2495592 RepID=UPI000F85E038|nr:autotransporter outer membrane beta-barrel domain-containing protein [Variovorax sp. DXTD-1]RST51123.1 autotransporter outer membrane beta-barrel domain-containing protein [Variovorax sp. DXTD-1]